MQSHSEGEKHGKIMSPNRRKKGGGVVGGWGRANRERMRELNCHLACIFGRMKISVIPPPCFLLWICQYRIWVKSSRDGFLTHSCWEGEGRLWSLWSAMASG